MGFFKTLMNGYKIMFSELNRKHNDLIPRAFTGCGTGLMMIGSAVMAKTAMKEDIQQVIAEADAAIEEAKKSIEGEKNIEQKKRVLKAKASKGWKIVKVFHKGIIFETVGAAGVGVGYGMAEHGKHRAIKACGALGAAFASYRAAVRNDLGEAADAHYMAGEGHIRKKLANGKKPGEIIDEIKDAQDTYTDDNGVTIRKDPNAFKFWFSEETCPSLWSANYDLRKANLEWVETNLNRAYMFGKHLSLNDMRREFGGLEPKKMDVGIGGIFGRVWDDNKPETHKPVNLHFRDDQDFMEGRTDSCWIIFDCDPDPIIGKINKKIKQMEK